MAITAFRMLLTSISIAFSTTMNYCLVVGGPTCIMYGAVELLVEAMSSTLSPSYIKTQIYSLSLWKQLPLSQENQSFD